VAVVQGQAKCSFKPNIRLKRHHYLDGTFVSLDYRNYSSLYVLYAVEILYIVPVLFSSTTKIIDTSDFWPKPGGVSDSGEKG